MEELNVSGVAVGAEDYREADRIVRILTPDRGVIRAVMRGVKKEKAKLKFAAMPFAFCEYSLMKRGAYYTVKTASPIESLFGVTRSPDAYLSGSVMLEAAAEAAGESAATDVFLRLLTTLKMLIYSDVGPYSLCLNFVFGLLKSGGFVSPSPADADYDVPPEEQTSLGDSALPCLKKYIRLFENKYVCRIRSAALL